MKKRFSLRQMLFVTCIAISLISVFLLATWVEKTAMENEMAAVKEKHLLLAQNLTGALSRYATDLISAFDSATSAAAADRFGPETKALLENLEIRDLSLLAETTLPPTRVFGQTATFGPKVLTLLAPLLKNASQAPKKVLFSGVVTENLAEPMLFLAKYVPGEGTWLGALRTNYFVSIQKAVSFGKKGHAAIVDRDGRVIAHPKSAWRLAGKDISKVSVVSFMMAGRTGVTTFYSPALKADMVAGYSSVPGLGWGVMIPQPLSELKERASHVQILALIMAAIGVLVAALVSWWGASFMSKTVAMITESAREISRGQYNLRVKTGTWTTPRELESLVQAFNLMTDEVEKHQAQLETRVAERTTELSEEISQRKAAEQQIRFLALHDPVTGLPNRMALQGEIEQDREKSGLASETVAVMFIDLDGFKSVNDRYGHKVGDLVLKITGQRLEGALRKKDFVARYGGDEFVAILGGIQGKNDANQAAENIRKQISRPYQVNDLSISVGVSIGVVITPAGDLDIDQILHEADIAMYKAKNDGKNRVCFADEAKPRSRYAIVEYNQGDFS